MDEILAGALASGLVVVFGHQLRIAAKVGAVCQEVKDIKEFILNGRKPEK